MERARARAAIGATERHRSQQSDRRGHRQLALLARPGVLFLTAWQTSQSMASRSHIAAIASHCFSSELVKIALNPSSIIHLHRDQADVLAESHRHQDVQEWSGYPWDSRARDQHLFLIRMFRPVLGPRLSLQQLLRYKKRGKKLRPLARDNTAPTVSHRLPSSPLFRPRSTRD